MWKILGEEAVIPTMPEVWKKRVVELSKKKADRDRFLALLDKGEMRVVLDGPRETWMFIINLPKETERKDLEFLAQYFQMLDKSARKPLLEMDGEAQKASIVVTTEEYSDDYDLRKDLRTKWKKEGFPGEKKAKAKKPKAAAKPKVKPKAKSK
ncbi:MAG TPA: hypothetical protein VMS79_04395 [Methanomassiliicoccales archaeon]|nr:hypothetical protein [Methanomassiliicoccales archaeon]